MYCRFIVVVLLSLHLPAAVYASQPHMLADVLKLRSQEADLVSQILPPDQLQLFPWSAQAQDSGGRFLKTKQPLVPDRSAPTIVHLWATWCQPCKREMQTVLELARSFSDARTTVRFVLVAEDDSEDAIRLFRHQYRDIGTVVPLYNDSAKVISAMLGRQMTDGAPGLPTTILIDRCGVVRQAFVGSLLGRQAVLKGALRRLTTATSHLTCPDEPPRPSANIQEQ